MVQGQVRAAPAETPEKKIAFSYPNPQASIIRMLKPGDFLLACNLLSYLLVFI